MASRRRSRRRVVRALVVVAVAIVIVAGGSVGYAMTRSDGADRYVSAVVGRGDVEQQLALTGTVKAGISRTVSFQPSGTVSSVAVAVGQRVAAGQTLATLQTAPLQAAVIQAQATLARANATLAADQNGTSTSTASANATELSSSNSESADAAGATVLAASPTTPAPTVTTSPTAGPRPSGGTSTPSASGSPASGSGAKGGGSSVTALQQQVKQAQAAASAASAAADQALTAAAAACASNSSPTSSAPTSATPSGSTSTSTGTTDAPPTNDPGAGGCLSALQTVQAKQRALSTAQANVTRLQTELTTALARQAASAGNGSSGSKTGTGSSGNSSGSRTGTGATGTKPTGTGQTGSGGSGSSGSQSSSSTSRTGTGGSTTDTATKVLTDKAAILSATTDLSDAQRDLAAATLTSPIAGTVSSVGYRAGTASSGSSITVIGTGGATVTVDVALANLPSVKVGQLVHVTPDGSTTAVTGTVSAIGLLPTSTTSSSPSYPVTIVVSKSPPALASGARAQAAIVIATRTNVVVVANSALTRGSNGRGTVLVQQGTKTVRTTVQYGASGPATTEILSGVSAGQRVVLADRKVSLPTNSSNRISRLTGGTGTGPGFGGGTGGFGGPAGLGGPGG